MIFEPYRNTAEIENFRKKDLETYQIFQILTRNRRKKTKKSQNQLKRRKKSRVHPILWEITSRTELKLKSKHYLPTIKGIMFQRTKRNVRTMNLPINLLIRKSQGLLLETGTFLSKSSAIKRNDSKISVFNSYLSKIIINYVILKQFSFPFP